MDTVPHNMPRAARQLKGLLLMGAVLLFGRELMASDKPYSDGCGREDIPVVVSPSAGKYNAEIDASWCGEGESGPSFIEIKLMPKSAVSPDKDGSSIFLYKPTYETGSPTYEEGRKNYRPKVTWLAPNKLDISVDWVDAIRQQLTEVDGIAITYHIDHLAHQN